MAQGIVRTMIDMPVDLREEVNAHIRQTGETLKAFITRSVKAEMERDRALQGVGEEGEE